MIPLRTLPATLARAARTSPTQERLWPATWVLEVFVPMPSAVHRAFARLGVAAAALVLLLAAPTALAQVKAVDWGARAAPGAMSPESYDPARPYADYGNNYDPRTDPRHPLKNPDVDPGAAWNRPAGANLPDSSPGVVTGNVDWNWGEQYFDAEFDVALIVRNGCKTPQPVRLFVNDLPYLTLPTSLVLPPGQSRVLGKVRLPPEPPPPLRLGLPGEPGWGHVNFQYPKVVVYPPPKIHQPNFVPITGTVVAWHPWSPAAGSECLPARDTYTVGGHIHFRPPPPMGEAGGPERIASPTACQVYWNTGLPPPQLTPDEDCTEAFRGFAQTLVERVLAPYVYNAPEAWAWLPGPAEISLAALDELLGWKRRADSQVGRP